jgi:hypothetical protein
MQMSMCRVSRRTSCTSFQLDSSRSTEAINGSSEIWLWQLPELSNLLYCTIEKRVKEVNSYPQKQVRVHKTMRKQHNTHRHQQPKYYRVVQ